MRMSKAQAEQYKLIDDTDYKTITGEDYVADTTTA